MATEAQATPLLTTFLVMDESRSVETGLEGMVAVAVPIAKCPSLRVDLNRAADLRYPKNHFGNPIDANSAPTHACCAAVVDVVNNHGLQILRCAYYTESLRGLRQIMGALADVSGLCAFDLKCMAAPIAEQSYIIPMREGFERRIAPDVVGQIHGSPLKPFQGAANTISIPFIDHFVDVVFVNRRHSALLQLVEVVGYLLHVLDYERQGKTLPPLKAAVRKVASSLDQSLIREELVHLTGAN